MQKLSGSFDYLLQSFPVRERDPDLRGKGNVLKEVLGGATAGQAPLACLEETSLSHVQSTAGHHSCVSRAQHCYCDWLGLDGPDP